MKQMKISLMFTALLLIAAFVFGGNSIIHTTAKASESEKAYDSISLAHSPKTEYAKLSGVQKTEIWKVQFDRALKTELTDAQRTLIHDLKNRIEGVNLDDDNFRKAFLKENWFERIKADFGSLNAAGKYFAAVGTFGAKASSSFTLCSCNVFNNFCGFNTEGEPLNCSGAGGCSVVPVGCGLLLVQTCDGTCQPFVID